MLILLNAISTCMGFKVKLNIYGFVLQVKANLEHLYFWLNIYNILDYCLGFFIVFKIIIIIIEISRYG